MTVGTRIVHLFCCGFEKQKSKANDRINSYETIVNVINQFKHFRYI